MINERIQRFCDDISKQSASNYPIHNVVLEKETEYIRNNYFKMLALLLQKEEDSHLQREFFCRLLAGAKTDYKIEDYIRQTLEFRIEEYTNFVFALGDNPLKYRFILDGMILENLGDEDRNNFKMISNFGEMFDFGNEEMKYLAEAAKAILELNEKAYVDVESGAVESIPMNIFDGYIFLISSDYICSNQEMTVFHPSSEENVTIELLNRVAYSKTKNVKITNVTVDLSDFLWYFYDKEKVIFEECHFIGGDKEVFFEDCGEIEIRNCCFENFSNHTIDKFDWSDKKNSDIKIKNSQFIECTCSCDAGRSAKDNGFGGVICSNKGELYLEGCTFEKCVLQNKGLYNLGYAFISNMHCIANKCSFIQCVARNYKKEILEYASMFACDSEEIDCIIKDSSKFC